MAPGQKGVGAVPSLLAALLAEMKAGRAELHAAMQAGQADMQAAMQDAMQARQADMQAKLLAGQVDMCRTLQSAVEGKNRMKCVAGVPSVVGPVACPVPLGPQLGSSTSESAAVGSCDERKALVAGQEAGGGGDASREVTPCLSASPPPGDGPLQPLTPPPSPCPHAAVSSSGDEKRKPPEFAGKVAFEAYLHQVVMAKFKSGDEREKLAGKQQVNGGCARSVTLNLPTTHCLNHNSLYSLRPPSSSRPHLVSSSSWTTAGRLRLNWFSGTCRSRCERGRHRHGSQHARGRRTRSLHRLHPCPFEPGSSSGDQDGHFVGRCPSATLGQTGDAHERGESDMRQSTLL